MGCSSCASQSMKGLGHFGAFIPSTPRQTILTTGPVESVPNATGGMHARISRAGMGDIFGTAQTNWISGVPNEYVAAAAALVLLLVVMK